MTVEQVGRTTNSVTINVSGITEGDRSTSVYIPRKNEWYTLHDAKENGYITDFYVANLVDNNGDITVVLNKNYNPFKLAYLKVENIKADGSADYITLPTILAFEYEGKFPKNTGDEIDITASDMLEINLFGSDIDANMGSGEGIYFTLSDMGGRGSAIYAEYLKLPAQNILNAALKEQYLQGYYYSVVTTFTNYILDNCKSGADFEATFFNDIYHAINDFNLSVTYP